MSTSSIQSTLASADQRQLHRLKHDPRLYVSERGVGAWNHPNDQQSDYRFETLDGDPINYLLHDAGPLNPSAWGGLNILLMARGLLKTTTVQAIFNWAHQFYGPLGLESYMGAPRDGQVKGFAGKWQDKLRWSGMDAAYQEKDAYKHKRFVFPTDSGDVVSEFKADTGWGDGDAMRGPHVHLGYFDEFQDASRRAFNAGFYEVIDRQLAGVPYFPAIFITGTPKLENSFFEELWQYSDQREWDPERGAWVAHAEAESFGDGDTSKEVRGWHVTQPNAPLHSAADIAAKRELKDEQEFKNEVLAEFYSPEDSLLSQRHLDVIAAPDLAFTDRRRFEGSWVTMGVDWGGGDDRHAGDTVATVMEHVTDEDGIVESYYNDIDFIHVDSKDDEFRAIEQKIIRYDPERIVVDEGFESKRREDLQEGNYTMDPDGYTERIDGVPRLVGVRYGNVSDVDKLKWKGDNKLMASADKTHMAKAFVSAVKAGRVVLPVADIDVRDTPGRNTLGTKVARQMTAPYQTRKEHSSGRKVSRIKSKSARNDDLFDASTYAWIARNVDELGPIHTETHFVSRTAPGHGG